MFNYNSRSGLPMIVSVTRQIAGPDSCAINTKVNGVILYQLPHFRDSRGLLSVAESGGQIPFEVKRIFLVSSVPGPDIRGGHAHLTLRQMLICVHGSCEVIADDGENRQSFLLDRPALGILLPPMVWGVQQRFTPDAVLLVLASKKYDPADYIRNYD